MPRDPTLSAGQAAGTLAAESRRGSSSAQGAMRTRIVAGSALCGVAALGLWWAFEQTATDPATRFAIARTHLAPGAVVEADDIALIAIRLPTEVAASAFASVDEIVGGVVVGSVHSGQLLARSDVVPSSMASDRQRGFAVAVELDRPRALNGLLASGERVGVVASGRSPTFDATLVVTDATVLHIDDPSSDQHQAATVTVTLQVPDLGIATELAGAADAGALTLIRTWGIP